ncbi:hypothetical protein BDM02DRAFT_3121425 [Thelephora ganbajun]|uniref:Uncharacterized protein n=1 Tax=Thelephora ganbajun TaxID=370292 RepID=A0ACB6Z4Y7_THEGA|nr:hypothetical protein BDM02DRAFT_3121425 [Thelephora ganbajun]
MAVFGYKERDPDERSFWGMLESEVGIRLEKVGECEGWPERTSIKSWNPCAPPHRDSHGSS